MNGLSDYWQKNLMSKRPKIPFSLYKMVVWSMIFSIFLMRKQPLYPIFILH